MSAINGSQSEIIQYGTFTLGDQTFGVNILRMREIIRPIDITKVPRAEAFMEGVINLRGVVIPVISMRARFGMPTRPFDARTRIINMEIDDTVVGFIVDSIGHVQRFPADAMDPAPAVTSSIETEYIQGVVTRADDQLLIVLDVDKLVSIETLKSFAQ